MARLAIYISDALEARIAAYKDNLNWSSVAQAAFERAISLEELKGKDMQEANIERLRQSREANTGRLRAQGVALGKRWASEEAEFHELEQVVGIADQLDEIADLDDAAAGAARLLVVAVEDETSQSWGEIAQVMKHLFGRESPAFVEIEGFVEGATAVHELV